MEESAASSSPALRSTAAITPSTACFCGRRTVPALSKFSLPIMKDSACALPLRPRVAGGELRLCLSSPLPVDREVLGDVAPALAHVVGAHRFDRRGAAETARGSSMQVELRDLAAQFPFVGRRSIDNLMRRIVDIVAPPGDLPSGNGTLASGHALTSPFARHPCLRDFRSPSRVHQPLARQLLRRDRSR